MHFTIYCFLLLFCSATFVSLKFLKLTIFELYSILTSLFSERLQPTRSESLWRTSRFNFERGIYAVHPLKAIGLDV